MLRPFPKYQYDFRTETGESWNDFFQITNLGLPQGMINREQNSGTNIINYPTWSTIVSSYDNNGDGNFDNIAVAKITNNRNPSEIRAAKTGEILRSS